MAKSKKTPPSKKKFVPTPRRGASADVLRVQAGAQKAGITPQTGMSRGEIDKAIMRGL